MRRKGNKEQNMESKENETDKERKSEDIVDEEIERCCPTKTKITQHLSTTCQVGHTFPI